MYTYPDNWVKKTALPHLALLLLLTIIANSKIWNAGFMSWDDLGHVQQIPALHTCLGWEQLKQWFT